MKKKKKKKKGTTMASTSIRSPSSSSSSTTTTSKRLLFDRRYGFVIDEWKHPSEEALTGGRGMFCIVPLARNLLKMASQSINLAASSAVKALEKPDVFSPHVLQAGFKDQLYKVKSSFTNLGINSFFIKGNQHVQIESNKSQIG